MTEKEKKLKRRLMNGKQKQKNLGTRIYFSREKESEMKYKNKNSQKISETGERLLIFANKRKRKFQGIVV